MSNWISDFLGGKGVNKEASQTDAKHEFEKKVKASSWLEGTLAISEDNLKQEEEAKITAELAVRDEIHKEAGYSEFETTEETLKQDYSRDVKILSDYALGEMIAEVRGHNNQDYMENASEYKEKAKKDVKSDRKAVEKELLDNVGLSAQVDWKKSFKKYTDEGTPKQPKENSLYKDKLEKVDDKLSEGGKEKDYSQTDEEHAKTMLGVGREEKDRTDVTAQPGEVHKDASLVRDPDTELKVGTLIRLARNIMSHGGQILNEGTSWEISGIDGYHYTLSANGQKHVISSHDTPKFDTLSKKASQKEAGATEGWEVWLGGKMIDKVFYVPGVSSEEVKKGLIDHDNYDLGISVKKEALQEITNHATKAEVIAKIAECKSPWAVVEKDGQEVIARISDEQVSKESKESEEEEKENLNK